MQARNFPLGNKGKRRTENGERKTERAASARRVKPFPISNSHSGSPADGSRPQICPNLRNLRFPLKITDKAAGIAPAAPSVARLPRALFTGPLLSVLYKESVSPGVTREDETPFEKRLVETPHKVALTFKVDNRTRGGVHGVFILELVRKELNLPLRDAVINFKLGAVTVDLVL